LLNNLVAAKAVNTEKGLKLVDDQLYSLGVAAGLISAEAEAASDDKIITL